ncbi:hypothetical protein BDW75DRAFT_225696 [Aspergillus navahoensis]
MMAIPVWIAESAVCCLLWGRPYNEPYQNKPYEFIRSSGNGGLDVAIRQPALVCASAAGISRGAYTPGHAARLSTLEPDNKVQPCGFARNCSAWLVGELPFTGRLTLSATRGSPVDHKSYTFRPIRAVVEQQRIWTKPAAKCPRFHLRLGYEVFKPDACELTSLEAFWEAHYQGVLSLVAVGSIPAFPVLIEGLPVSREGLHPPTPPLWLGQPALQRGPCS